MCMLSFGSYFVYDNPAALQRNMINDLDIDYSTFMLQYSLYSWPNVILSLLGGFLIDRVFGIRLGTVVFSAFVCAGQVVYAIGCQFGSIYVMLAGRFIFGLGGENLAVAQNAYVVSWFKGAELNMVFGLLLSVSRVGSTVNMNTLGQIYDALKKAHIKPPYVRLAICLWIGFGWCLISLACAVALGFFDRRAEKILKKKEGKVGEVIRIKDVFYFPLSLWIVFFVCVFYYVTVFPFIGLAVVFYEDKWLLSAATANLSNSLVYIISAVASPLLGLMVDFIGFNVFWVILGTVLTLICHVLLGFTLTPPVAVSILMGLSYSLLACGLWPMVSYIVPEHHLGTAYGIMQAVQNLGLAVVSYVAGFIVDAKGYLVYEVFNCALLCVALMLGIILYVLDSAKGSNINISAKKRKALAKKEEEEATSGSDNVSNEDEKVPINTDAYKVKPAPYESPIEPRSSAQIRMRYMSRMSSHWFANNPSLSHSGTHVGVLK